MCPSPQLFAACRVFLRPLVPRHPPCAFLCLTFLGCIALQPLFPFLGRNSPVFLFTACSCLFVSRLSWFPHLLCFHHSVLYEVFKVHAFFCKPRQPPAFPCRPRHSILGRPRLNRRVRDVYGCAPQAHRHQGCAALSAAAAQAAALIAQQWNNPYSPSLERR